MTNVSKIFGSLAFGLLLLALTTAACVAQSINLKEFHAKGKLIVSGSLRPLDGGDKRAVTGQGIAWIKGKSFSTGVIEVDLRGKDVLQKSFLGIAFHGVDTTTYDAIYFRPFNFKSTDSVRRIHAVQYISAPDYHWERLRREFNGVYEKGIASPPDPNEWFHARIEVGETTIRVFVNNASIPSLVVNKLNNRKSGLVGLWSFKSGVDSDFANLKIKD